MNKQIEEMMEVIHNAEINYFTAMLTADIDDAIDGVASRDEIAANALYNAGYRKASEVAREIFEEIEENVFKYRSPYGESHRNTVVLTEKCFYELKKKYESEGADDDTKPN